MEALIVKLSMKPTRLSGWSGLARTWTMTLGMLCSPTNAAFRRKLIAGSAAGREASPPKNKPRPKHPVKVHVWAGISMRGRTGICILELWMLLCTQTFLKQPCFRSSMTPTQTVTSLCRIMITKYGLASQQLCNCCRRLLCNCFSSEHFVHCA